jgi:hypothetical protein
MVESLSALVILILLDASPSNKRGNPLVSKRPLGWALFRFRSAQALRQTIVVA